MNLKVQFISLDEDDKDLILSFAVDDAETGIKSLILHRTLFFEHFLDEEERGVRVAFEGDYFDQEDINMLSKISIGERVIEMTAPFREYHLDISGIDRGEIDEAVGLLERQNYDGKFGICIV